MSIFLLANAGPGVMPLRKITDIAISMPNSLYRSVCGIENPAVI